MYGSGSRFLYQKAKILIKTLISCFGTSFFFISLKKNVKLSSEKEYAEKLG
jgi:hypothetical protein